MSAKAIDAAGKSRSGGMGYLNGRDPLRRAYPSGTILRGSGKFHPRVDGN